MKAYIWVSGAFFVIVSVTHSIRAFVEQGAVTSANFVVSSMFAVIMAIWAATLIVRRQSRAAA
jgi:hypothetical protein